MIRGTRSAIEYDAVVARKLASEIAISGTPEQIWSVLTDFPEYAEWNPFIRQASGDVKQGARLKVRIYPPGGRPMTFRPTVREALPPRELRWLGHLWLPGLLDGEHLFRIEATGDGRSRLRQTEQFRGLLVPLVPAVTYERTGRGFEAMNRALKERIENL
jgi:hypothetical protein